MDEFSRVRDQSGIFVYGLLKKEMMYGVGSDSQVVGTSRM